MGLCASGMNEPRQSNMTKANPTIGGYQSNNQSNMPHIHRMATAVTDADLPPDERAQIQRAIEQSKLEQSGVTATNYNSDVHQRQRQQMLAATEARIQAQKSKSTRTYKHSTKYTTNESKEQVTLPVSEPDSPTIQSIDQSNNPSINQSIKAPARRRAGSMEANHPEYFGASAVTTRE